MSNNIPWYAWSVENSIPIQSVQSIPRVQCTGIQSTKRLISECTSQVTSVKFYAYFGIIYSYFNFFYKIIKQIMSCVKS